MGTQESVAGGMFVRGSESRVPLTGVQIDIDGNGAAARVCVRQRFVNAETVPIEAVYSFPLEEGSAVHEMRIEIGGRRLVGQIEEREKAFEDYDEALAAGNGAFLADQDRPNIFTMSVGNLLPGQEATVSLAYATELEQHGSDVRIMLPTTIAPRYVPAAQKLIADPAELERLNPPTVLGPVPYGLTLRLNYTAQHGVKAVACPSHPAHVEIDGNLARVELLGSNIQLDRDFVANITLQRPFEPSASVMRETDGSHAVMVNVYPDLTQYWRAPSEFIFMLDRSGSMSGESISQALNALTLALHSLEENDTFNILGFGSGFEQMFPHSQAYTQASLEAATQRLASWSADMGGTELLPPLKAVLHAAPGKNRRQIILLTDGQVSNEAQCIAVVQQHAATTQLFSFGIGYGASEFLVKGLARAGGGQAEFIHPNERIEPKVMRQFARAAAPCLQNLRLDWGGFTPDLVSPGRTRSLFNGERFTAYAHLVGATPGKALHGAILADSSHGTLRLPFTIDLHNAIDNSAVPVLMARAAIRDLEESTTEPERTGSRQRGRKQQNIDKQVLALALRYRILSSQTSFIAVDERTEDASSTRAQLRRVPVALTRGMETLDMPVFLRRASPSAVSKIGAIESRMLRRTRHSLPRFGFLPQREERDQASRSSSVSAFGDTDQQWQALMDIPAFMPSSHRKQKAQTRETTADRFMQLALSQQADGRFQLQPAVLKAFAIEDSALTKAVKALGATKEAVSIVHTAIALALFARDFANREDEWRLLASKATRWLDKQAATLPDAASSWGDWGLGML